MEVLQILALTTCLVHSHKTNSKLVGTKWERGKSEDSPILGTCV